MLDYAKDNLAVKEALPLLEREIKKLPRQYLVNIIHTLVGKPFAAWVDRKVNERNAKVTIDKDQIEMDPDIAAIYQASTTISGK